MLQRRQKWIALVSIALIAVDGVVGAIGHSHRHPPKAGEAPCCVAHQACPCHYDGLQCGDQEHDQRHSPDSAPHDDCTLCRHLSQPVAAVILAPLLTTNERVEFVVAEVASRESLATMFVYAARGPPLHSV